MRRVLCEHGTVAQQTVVKPEAKVDLSESKPAAAAASPVVDKAPLEPLIYPLIQIIFGVFSVQKSTKYHPLRVLCARLLNQLARASGSDVYIPVAAQMLPIFQNPELKKVCDR